MNSPTTRRQFLIGLATLGVSSYFKPCYAQAVRDLAGTDFVLTIGQTAVNFNGQPRIATTINGSLPAPTLHWREGDTVTLHVINTLNETSSIHWHGILLPYAMDGVPGISFEGIPAHGSFTYQFKVQQTGTYWYHSHSAMQEQTGLYGAIIIEPREREQLRYERDYVLVLSDWTNEDPLDVFAKLKKQSDYYNFNQPTVVDFIRDLAELGVSKTLNKREMWSRMRMSMTDLSDISAYTYTYLMNGKTAADNWTGLFRKGERVRLRLINAAAQTMFDVRIQGLKMTVVQADGQNIEPVSVDELRIGLSETYDVMVAPEAEAYTIFAQSMDRTGYVRGTLATQHGLTAVVPAVDQPEPLSMTDMMGDMQNPVAVRHATSEFGASVDMRVDTPRLNLDDPGVGLRNNGRRVLTYADLRTIGGSLDARPPQRDIELHLTGNMKRYSWSFDGIEFKESTPLHLHHGERVRIILVNDTMMTHPIHLHGMWSELETADGQFQVRKHTINVQPAQRVSFLVTADAHGSWPWHCHLFYHMHAGMFRVVVVD